MFLSLAFCRLFYSQKNSFAHDHRHHFLLHVFLMFVLHCEFLASPPPTHTPLLYTLSSIDIPLSQFQEADLHSNLLFECVTVIFIDGQYFTKLIMYLTLVNMALTLITSELSGFFFPWDFIHLIL